MLTKEECGADMHIVMNEVHLLQRSWCFGHSASVVYAPLLRFGAGGRLIGYRHANENSWAILDGKVALLDEMGLPSTIFDRSSVGSDGRLRLEGRHRDGSVMHFLREVVLDDDLMPYSPHIKLVQRRPVGRRRHLVVLRANEESLHSSWLRDITDGDRSWDLCISYYGQPETFPPDDFSEFMSLQPGQRKFTALKSLMHKASILWNYDYIMFPDDDLQMKWSDLNILFNICSEYELQLAQPSLDPDGVINLKLSQQKADFLLRFVTMVEVMTPIFSVQALRRCVHTFDLNESGFGLDYVWTKLVDGPLTKIAVIDRVAVLHTRALGARYDLKAAIDEGYNTADKFGFLDQNMIRELGGILAHKVFNPEDIKADKELALKILDKPVAVSNL